MTQQQKMIKEIKRAVIGANGQAREILISEATAELKVSFEQQRLIDLARKFRLNAVGLEVEGLPAPDQLPTLADEVKQRDFIEKRGIRESKASVIYRGRPVAMAVVIR